MSLVLSPSPLSEWQSSIDSRYIAAALEMKTNSEITSEVKRIFHRVTKKKSKCIEFQVSDRIEYMPLFNFFGNDVPKLVTDSLGISLNNASEYDEKNEFSVYKLPYMPRLSSSDDSILTLTFLSL